MAAIPILREFLSRVEYSYMFIEEGDLQTEVIHSHRHHFGLVSTGIDLYPILEENN